MEYLVYLLGVVVFLFVAMQIAMFVRAKGQQGKPAPELGDLLSEEQRDSDRLLFYFYSERCGSCRAVSRLIDNLAETNSNIVKIDVMQRPDVARSFSVMGTPTLVQVDSGQISHVHIGSITEKKLAGMV